MASRLVYLYDASPINVRDRRVLLQEQLRRAGVLDDWEVRATPSRNALLVSLYADAAQRPRRASVTLIDLRAETGDLEQIGFKVCDRLTRHPSLRRVTRPVIWSDVHTAANLQYARGVGAVAIVDDEWVDSGGADAPLVDVLRWSWAQPAERHAHARAPRVFPRDSSSVEAEERERRERFERWFGYPPSDLNLEFALLWGMAEAVELKLLLTSVTEAGLARSERAARRRLEQLQAAMAPDVEALDSPETARAEIARRFLAESAPPEPPRFDELTWPKPQRIAELLTAHPQLREWAFLVGEEPALLERFLDLYEPPPPHAGAGVRHEALEGALKQLARVRGATFARVHESVHRAIWAVEDAFSDWRNYGDPLTLG
ncbi:MAG TPA: hypothetical protein VME22_09475 [Solirubrobacteraceae bacterium]|nr:hypothetical protein [Solirubrobacteraceae bacterium]